jgi:hypothetical protein
MNMMYYFHWIDEKLDKEPNLKGSPIGVEAATPKAAWEKFLVLHPNLKDGEGSYYVMIRSSRIPHDDESDVLAEAGKIRNKTPYFQPWR